MERLFNYEFMGLIAEFVPLEVKSVSKSFEVIQLRNMFSLLKTLRKENDDLFSYLKNLSIEHIKNKDNLPQVSEKVNYLFKKAIFDIETFDLRGCTELFSRYRQLLQDGALGILAKVLLKNLPFLSIPTGPAQEIRRWFANEDHQITVREITLLNLTGKNLLCIPDEMRFFTGLRTLLLGDNSIMNIPRFIGELTNLRDLHLGSNLINYLPAEIGQLTKLNYLYLYENQIGVLPSEIGSLVKLIILELRRNRIHCLPDSICNLNGLRAIELSENNLTELPDNLYRLSNLRELTLEKNQISKIPATLQGFFQERCFTLYEQRANPLGGGANK